MGRGQPASATMRRVCEGPDGAGDGGHQLRLRCQWPAHQAALPRRHQAQLHVLAGRATRRLPDCALSPDPGRVAVSTTNSSAIETATGRERATSTGLWLSLVADAT